ncbi:hypothetical protein HAV_00159 [Candidatus Hepatincola sp. Av]
MKYIDATKLNQWSDTKEAQNYLPELVRRLIINSSKNVHDLKMPSGDSTSKTGVDGKFITNDAKVLYGTILQENCENLQTIYLEIGTNKDVKKKFNDDIKTRAKELKDQEFGTIIFIFITSRRFYNTKTKNSNDASIEKQTIIDTAKSTYSKQWKDIKIFDADDLESWLDQDFATMAWLCYKMNIPCSMQSPERYFEEWLASTKIPLDKSIVLARLDKGNQVDSLFNEFVNSNEKYTLTIISDSRKESVLYAINKIEDASTINQETPNKEFYKKIIIIEDKPTWNYIIEDKKENHYILIPTFGIPDNLGFVNKNIKVILPLNNSEKRDVQNHSKVIQLEELNRELLIENLKNILNTDEAKAYKDKIDIYSIVDKSKNTLLSLQRLLVKPDSPLPSANWMQEENSNIILKLAMLGSFNTNNNKDKEILVKFLSLPFEEIELQLKYYQAQEETVIKQFDNVQFSFINPELILRHYSNYISKTILDSFEAIVIEAISNQLNKKVKGFPTKEEYISSSLINGVFNTLAIMGSLSEQNLFPTSIAMEYNLKSFVNSMLKEKLSINLWWNLSKQKNSLLIEASPEAMIDIFKNIFLEHKDEKIIEIFYTNIPTNLQFIPNNFLIINILWLLEQIALISNYTQDVLKILVKLIHIEHDIKYKSGNSALNSLFNILNPYNNKSNLSFTQKEKFIKKCIKEVSSKEVKVAIIHQFISLRSWIVPNSLPFIYKVKWNPRKQDENNNHAPLLLFLYQQLIDLKEEEALLDILNNLNEVQDLLKDILAYMKEKEIFKSINSNNQLQVKIKIRIDNLQIYAKDKPNILEFINEIDNEIKIEDIEEELIIYFNTLPPMIKIENSPEVCKLTTRYYKEKKTNGILNIIENLLIPQGYKFNNFIYSIIKCLELKKNDKKKIVNLLVSQKLSFALYPIIEEHSGDIVAYYNAYYDDKWDKDKKMFFILAVKLVTQKQLKWLEDKKLIEDYWKQLKEIYCYDDTSVINEAISNLYKYKQYGVLLNFFAHIINQNYKYQINIKQLLDVIQKGLSQINNYNDLHMYIDNFEKYIKKHAEANKDILLHCEFLFFIMRGTYNKPDFDKNYPNLKKAIEDYQSNNPFFIQLLQLPKDKKQSTQNISNLLKHINFIPLGYNNVGQWVKIIREKSKNVSEEILNSADYYIANILSKSTVDPEDNIFPHKKIREIFEKEQSKILCYEFYVSFIKNGKAHIVNNSTTQEFHNLYLQYQGWAESDELIEYPLTIKILKDIASYYKGMSESNNKWVNFGLD